MRPAMRPDCSCEVPSVAEIVSEDCTVKLIGSAPNLSWSASDFDDSCVKLPVICGRPSVIAPFIWGAVSTAPSRTNANWSRGDWPLRPYRRVLTSPKSSVPCSSNWMFTAH